MRCTRIHVATAAAAVLGLTASVIGLTTAGAGVEGDPRNASADPSTIAVGGATEVTPDTKPDDYCETPPEAREASTAGVAVVVTISWSVRPAGGGATEMFGSQATSPDGFWDVTVDTDPAPADDNYLAPGDYEFSAFCSDPNPPLRVAGGGGFVPGTYLVPFTVAGPVEPEFDVTSDKASGPPGTTVELTGIDCVPGLGSFVAVKFMPAGAVPEFDNSDESLAVYEVVDGDFTGSFVVPAGTAPGTYQLVAWCLGEGGQPLDGTEAQVLGFTVTAAVVPVVEDPDFTG